jgi:arginine deiminase
LARRTTVKKKTRAEHLAFIEAVRERNAKLLELAEKALAELELERRKQTEN